jgi:hypothetical protein
MESLPGGDKIILFVDNASGNWLARVSADLSSLKWCKLLEGNVHGAKVEYRTFLSMTINYLLPVGRVIIMDITIMVQFCS